MRTYFRILAYAKPYRSFLPQYILLSVLAIIFGLVNLSMFIPVMEVLFDEVNKEEVQAIAANDTFSFSISYIRGVFYRFLLDIQETSGSAGALQRICILIIGFMFLTDLCRYLSEMVLTFVRVNIVRGIRSEIFSKVTEFQLAYFTDKNKGDLISRMTNDVQEIEFSIGKSLKVLFKEPATVIFYFIALFIISPQLTIYSILVLPVSAIVIGEINRRLRRQAREGQNTLGKMLNIMDESLSGLRIIKAFNARTYINSIFNREVDQYRNLSIAMARKNELAPPTSEFFGVSLVAIIIMYGGFLVLSDSPSLNSANFVGYVILLSQIISPAKAFTSGLTTIQKGIAAGERIFAMLDTEAKIVDKPNAREIKSFQDSIEFKDVSFSYEEDEVLSNINITIKKGETVALVGPSGGGKSTIADLIARFYDPTSGQVLVDGVDLRDCKIESVRAQMGIVTQEALLFNDTISNNISFGSEEVTLEKVREAAKIAYADEFISETSNGYETIVGDRGVKLSGGQRQRICIARAVLKNPPILILDEATSALDSESEKIVQSAITNLMKNRTSLIIAHRLSTIRHADKIIVVDNGKIIQEGTHDKLMNDGGLYQKLNEMQSV